MKYSLANPHEAEAAFAYLNQLNGKHSLVEIKKISPTRTLNQNSYLHLLIGYFGAHFGYTIEEAKQIYKEINKSIYMYDKNARHFWRSSTDLSVDEMTKTIELFRDKSGEAGCPLPTASDSGWLKEIDNEIERSKYYL